MQKQKTVTPGNDDTKPKPGKLKNNPELQSAAQIANDLVSDLEEASKKRGGYWEECCGIRYWVED